MLPRSTNTRSDRESVKGRLGGRTQEISRLVGRSLRAVVDTKALGENTVVLDCDVLQADGGTRTAAITGAYVALADAIGWATGQGLVAPGARVLVDSVAAVSVGIVDGVPRLDLHYDDDVRADTDMNVVMTGSGAFVEVQGTAEGAPFDRGLLDGLLDLATRGCAELADAQREALAGLAVVTVRVVLATRNRHKVAELSRILSLGHLDVELVGTDAFPDVPDVPETGSTFAANALLKAHAVAAATGLPAVADDSGLCVDALNGMPGILSARWSGRHGDDAANLELVLGQLLDVPEGRRGAQFRCAAAVAMPPSAGGRGRSASSRASSPACWCGSRGGTTGSATTRSSCRSGTTAPPRRCPRRRRTRSATGVAPSGRSPWSWPTCCRDHLDRRHPRPVALDGSIATGR